MSRTRMNTKLLMGAASVALAAGGSFHGVAAKPRADTSSPAALIGELTKAFETFKVENDARIAALAKGQEDVVQTEKVDKINATITEMSAAIDEMTKRNAALELNSSGDGQNLVAEAKAFAKTMNLDEPQTPDDYAKYVSAMDRYMRRGANSAGQQTMNLLETGSDPNGGYTVPTAMSEKIIKRIFETSDMRGEADQVTIGTDSIEGVEDRGELDTGWVGEKEAREDTGTPTIGLWKIDVHEQYAMPLATQKLLDDSAWDIENWLANKVSDRFTREENRAFIAGDGVLKPRGLLTYPTAAVDDATRAWGTFEHVAAGATNGISNTDTLIDFIFALKAGYRGNAKWYMNRKSVAEIRKLKDGDGNYLWQPDFAERQGGNLLGYAIKEMEDMPDIAANANSIAFGDMKQAYLIVDRTGIRVIRDNLTRKGFIKFYTTKRVGGGAQDYDSMKFLKFTA